jgi:DNA-binding PadR family transcriptional regulator
MVKWGAGATFIYVSMLSVSVLYMCEHRHGFCHYPGRGLIQLLILRILHEKPSHGYQIMEELERITSEKYIPEPGAVYTMLRRMEKRGLLASEWEKKESGADRRVYTLTEAGMKVLKEGLEMVKKRRQLIDSLVQFYDAHFIEKEKGGGT